MSRNTKKNASMEQHPEMAKAMAKTHARPNVVKRNKVGIGSGSSDHPRPFEMWDSPLGAGEVIARAIHYDEHGVNDLPEDAVILCVFRQFAKIPMGGACKHVTVRRSELTPFDVSLYPNAYARKESKNVGSEGKEEVLGDGEGKDGAEPA